MKYRAAVRIKDGVVDESFKDNMPHYMRLSEEEWLHKLVIEQGKDSLVGGQWWFVEVETED